MRGRAIAMLGLAVVLAGTAVFLARNWIEEQARPVVVQQAAPVDNSVTVVVAKDRLTFGSPLRREQLRLRSEEHTSELQSLMRISYAVFCLKKKNIMTTATQPTNTHHNLYYTKTLS